MAAAASRKKRKTGGGATKKKQKAGRGKSREWLPPEVRMAASEEARLSGRTHRRWQWPGLPG